MEIKEILSKWNTFKTSWEQGEGKRIIDGKKMFIKPTFYDFMEWLTNNPPPPSE